MANRIYAADKVIMDTVTSPGITADQETKLRNSFKRCTPETIEAILRFRNERDLSAVVVVVHGVIERYLKLKPENELAFRPDSTRLGEDLGIDSLTMLEIVMSIEEALDFRIEDAEARKIRTLGDVRRYIDDRVHERPISPATLERYDRDRLCLILPQQPPFLFLDRAEIEGETVRASYVFREEEFFFPGHFRDDPVVPASIVYEAIGQACCLWVLERTPSRLALEVTPSQVLFVGMGEARFFKRARPLDEIQIEQTLTKLRSPLAIFEGTVKVGGQLLARVEGLTLAFGDFDPAFLEARSDKPKAEANGTGRHPST
jgi:acyl carrier protein